MKRLILAFVLVLAGCSPPKQALNVFIWSEYIDPKIVADFERQFDCQVSISLYEDNESMMAKLAAGGTALYDIVVPSNYVIVPMAKRGLLAPIRRQNVPNFSNLDSRFVNLAFDLGNQYSMPYQWGTEGIYLRRPKDKPVEETWGLIFDRTKQPGPFLLIEDARLCLGAALRYKGHSLNSTNPVELAEARDLLVDAKKRSLGFEVGVGGKNRVLSKGAVLAMTSSGDAVRGTKEDPDTYYFVPREGSSLWVDNLCIPAKAPHRDLAEKFINFILDPKVGARLSNFNQFASPNRAALEFVNPADLKNPAIYPPADQMPHLELYQDLGDALKLYDELWTQVKAK